MKKLIYACGLGILMIALNISLLGQDNQAKSDDFNKIAKLTKSKKPEDREKAFQLSKEFVKKYGTGTDDDSLKKIKLYLENYQLELFNTKLNENKTAEAFTIGKQILAEQPENSYVTFSLAFAGFDANLKTKTTEFNQQAIEFAEKTLKLFEAGKLPKAYTPFKDQTEVTALMYYLMGSLQIDTELNKAAFNFYKAVSFESQFKSKAYAYNIIAFNYEQIYTKAAEEFIKKHGSKPVEDAAMKADTEKINKILANMLDAYARAIKFGEAEKNPTTETWKKRFAEIYQFMNKTSDGAAAYLTNEPNKPLPDPSAN